VSLGAPISYKQLLKREHKKEKRKRKKEKRKKIETF
jgi:hypothetical protein